MAHTRRGAEMTEQHRQAQVALGASLVDVLRDLFLDLFNIDNIDGSSKEFVKKALPMVLAYRDVSAEMAATYLDTFRKMELRGLVDHSQLPADVVDPHAIPMDILEAMADVDLMDSETLDNFLADVSQDLPSVDKVVQSLYTSTANVAKAQVKNGATNEEVQEKARQAMEAKVIRLVSDGGRAPLLREVSTGGHGAVGYARVVDADPCLFCAMLASRGAVYRSDAFSESNGLFSGDGAFKVHDGCQCTLEPVYGKRATDLPPGGSELAREWAEYAAGQPDPWAAWQRWRKSGTKPGEEHPQAWRGVDGNSRASAPQHGREAAKRDTSKRKGRKKIDELDIEELEQTLKGLRIRRSGLEADLAKLEARGQSVTEPGPAQHIDVQLKRIEKQLAHGQRRLDSMRHS